MADENDRLAHWAVGRFLRLNQLHPDYEDAVQVARLVLLNAGEHFRPELGLSFATYAVPSMQRRLILWKKIERRNGFRATGDCSKAEAADPPPKPTSLSGHDEDGRPLLEILATATPDRVGWLDGDDVARAMRRLPRRDAEVLCVRYWEGLTLVEAGVRFGVSRGMIHLIEKRAIKNLRRYLGVGEGV